MQCDAIMTRDCAVLRDTDCLADAIGRLLGERHLGLPVVDKDGAYVGMFTIDDILGLVIPRVALAGDHTPNLRFVRDACPVFAEWKSKSVGALVTRNGVVLAPDTLHSEAVRIFARSRNPLAVVDPDDGKFLGVLSFWDCMAAFVQSEGVTDEAVSA